MKNKTLPIILVILAIIIIAIVVITTFIKNKNYKDCEIKEISYSYGGGYGTIIDASKKTITFTQNGIVILSNSYNSYTETVSIDQSKYNELSDFIKDNLSLFDEKPKENKNVMDGSSSSIRIELKDGQSKEIGGYMIENKKFKKIEHKIYEIIDHKILIQYNDNISMYEQQD